METTATDRVLDLLTRVRALEQEMATYSASTGICYQKRGPTVHEKSKRARTVRMIRQLRSLGYRVEPLTAQLNPA